MSSTDLNQLVSDVVSTCGVAPPIWMNPDAPVLKTDHDDGTLFLIGVIGGKDVGKSSLINALIGQNVARVSNTGEGTSRALAYVYHDDVPAARRRLDDLIAGQYEIISHEHSDGKSRLLIDLPDIDSIYSSHVELTRQSLKGILYPIWVQSIEKYADREPLQLLSQVATGNSPENFVFVLTKCDQLAARHGESAVPELSADYASRLAKICGLKHPPRVYCVNGRDRMSIDLPELAARVMSSRSQGQVNRSIELARMHRDSTIIDWLRGQGVHQQLQSMQRLEESVKEMVHDRLTEPMADELSNRLEKDGSLRSRILEPIIRSRLSYWPIVNIIDATLGPVIATFSSASAKPLASAISQRSVGRLVQGAFSELSQRDSRVLELYQHQKLWEQDPADSVASRIEQQLDQAIESHQASLLKVSSKPSIFARVIAPFATIGVALWFPIIQPILNLYLQQTTLQLTKETLLFIVQILSAEHLIRSVGLLSIYFITLWMWLRWRAACRLTHTLRQTTADDHPARVIFAWAESLSSPVSQQVEKLQSLNDRIEAIAIQSKSAA